MDAIRTMCNTQIKNIESVVTGLELPNQNPPKAAENDVDDTVRSIESSASRIQADSSLDIDIDSAKKPAQAPARQRKLDSTQPFTL